MSDQLTAVEQLEEMLDQIHERDLMDLIIWGYCFVNGKTEGKILLVFGHSPSLTEYQTSKVVAHERMQVFRGECFDRTIGLFMRRSYRGCCKDKVTAIG